MDINFLIALAIVLVPLSFGVWAAFCRSSPNPSRVGRVLVRLGEAAQHIHWPLSVIGFYTARVFIFICGWAAIIGALWLVLAILGLVR